MTRTSLFPLVLSSLLSACGNSFGDCDPSLPLASCPGDATVADDDDSATPPDDTAGDDDSADDDDSGDDDSGDDDSGDTEPTPQQQCWDDVAFGIHNRTIDWSIATTVTGDWTELSWVDTDPVQLLDASSSTNVVTVFASGDCGGAIETTMYLPEEFSFPDLGEQYNNGIITALQPNGTVLEVNYMASCGDGSWHGYVLPDSDPLDACDVGIDTTRWLGAHGGSHFTATQAIREGELTGSDPIGRPLPIEVDNNHLYYGTSGYRWPAASADSYAASEYSGAIPDLVMGSVLVLPQGFDCTVMTTVAGERLCEVARDHGFVIVDDSYGNDEVAFPITPEAQAEAESSLGCSLHNSQDTAFGADVETMMVSIRVLTNPEAAWTSTE